MKVTREEKALIKAYVNLETKKNGAIELSDINSIAFTLVKIIGNLDGDYRTLVTEEIERIIFK